MTVTAKDINGDEIKVGDTVERVEGYNGNMVVGDKGVVLDIESGFYLTIEGYNLQHVARKCKKLIQPFAKSDLKTGMVVKLRSGDIARVLLSTNNGDIVAGDTWFPLCSLCDDLTHRNFDKADVVEVYQPVSNKDYVSLNDKGTLVWEREEVLTKEQLRIKELEEGITKMQEELNKLL